MKLVLGDKVIENAEVNVGKSRSCEHDMEGRIKYWVEIVIPASEQHGGYAVRQLFGRDPNINAREVVLFEVALTNFQAEQIRRITEADLLAIQNGNNPTTIYSVNLYEDVPIKSPSVLQHESAVETVQPSGEYLGCVQWFQHNMPEVIIRRDSHHRATFFERDLPPSENVLWDYHYSEYVKIGYWKEITEQEAMRRIEANRKLPRRGLECGNPDCGMKGRIEDLDSPFVSIPCRGCDSKAMSGVDWGSGPDTMVQTEFRVLPLTMTLRKTLSHGIWAVCPTAEQKPTVLFIAQETTLDTEIPAVLLTAQTYFKTPANVRQPVMPKDFGKVIWWHDAEDSLVGNIPKHRSGKLIGQTGNVLMIEGESGRSMHVYESKAFIVDPQTEGF